MFNQPTAARCESRRRRAGARRQDAGVEEVRVGRYCSYLGLLSGYPLKLRALFRAIAFPMRAGISNLA